MEKEKINIVWFKRDLRLTDHKPLLQAQLTELPVLLIYIFEPSLMSAEDSDSRHWRFVYQSLQDMQERLSTVPAKLYIFHNEVLNILSELTVHFDIQTVYSHEETGNWLSFKRDVAFSKFCAENKIRWVESPTNGIVRKLRSHRNWEKRWFDTMTSRPAIISEKAWKNFQLNPQLFEAIRGANLPAEITVVDQNFQQGGETLAWRYLDSFLKGRYERYSTDISKPSLSRKSCSRLSPYLAYGNISMRMVYQYTQQHYVKVRNKRALDNFKSRLLWHCHFIQSFEDNCWMEFEDLNPAFRPLKKPKDETRIKAWQEGKTGVPLIDACMRCLVSTGYLNFRMRAMVVSFFVFNLWQDWRDLHFLARKFLDYEPGIHYPQLQMQSGSSKRRVVRIYNPIKNSEEHDPDGSFIKKWLPELSLIPTALLHEPWKLSVLEQELYQCIIGKDYPSPIVDLDMSRRQASEIIYAYKKEILPAEIESEEKSDVNP